MWCVGLCCDVLCFVGVPDLGLQAAQRIVLGSEPLKLMQDINQNFPRLMQSLCKLKARTPTLDLNPKPETLNPLPPP